MSISVKSGLERTCGVHAATASTGGDPKGDHPLYLLNSPLSSAQRAWSNICAPRLVQINFCHGAPSYPANQGMWLADRDTDDGLQARARSLETLASA